MEQHLPMRMSMLDHGPPSGNSRLSLRNTLDEYSQITAASVSGSPEAILSPSQLISTGTHFAGAKDDTTSQILNIENSRKASLELQLAGNLKNSFDTNQSPYITDYKYIVTYHICLFSDDIEVNGKGW